MKCIGMLSVDQVRVVITSLILFTLISHVSAPTRSNSPLLAVGLMRVEDEKLAASLSVSRRASCVLSAPRKSKRPLSLAVSLIFSPTRDTDWTPSVSSRSSSRTYLAVYPSSRPRARIAAHVCCLSFSPLFPPFFSSPSDPSAVVETTSAVPYAVIGGVLALLVFTVICVLIITIWCSVRQKGNVMKGRLVPIHHVLTLLFSSVAHRKQRAPQRNEAVLFCFLFLHGR